MNDKILSGKALLSQFKEPFYVKQILIISFYDTIKSRIFDVKKGSTRKVKYALSKDDSSNGRAVVLYPADPGSNPHSGSV